MVAKEEANLKSPIAGIVDNVIVKPGQVVGQGVPLMTIVPKDQWVVLNVTENNLNHFAVGSELWVRFLHYRSTINLPPKCLKFTQVPCYQILPRGAPPTAKTALICVPLRFVRARASQIRLRQGMTVLVDIPASQQPTQTQ